MCLQQLGKPIGHDGFAEVVPLHLITGVFLQEVHLFLRFHTFGHDGEAEVFAHGNDRLSNRFVLKVIRDVTDKGPVHFERINGKVFDLGEREKYPVPKSSMASRTPMPLILESTLIMRVGLCMTMLSVISSSSRFGAMSVSSSAVLI